MFSSHTFLEAIHSYSDPTTVLNDNKTVTVGLMLKVAHTSGK